MSGALLMGTCLDNLLLLIVWIVPWWSCPYSAVCLHVPSVGMVLIYPLLLSNPKKIVKYSFHLYILHNSVIFIFACSGHIWLHGMVLILRLTELLRCVQYDWIDFVWSIKDLKRGEIRTHPARLNTSPTSFDAGLDPSSCHQRSILYGSESKSL